MASCPPQKTFLFSVFLFILAAASNALITAPHSHSPTADATETATVFPGLRQRASPAYFPSAETTLGPVLRSANTLWFYIHFSCQMSAYIVGVAGWATGIKLGSDSPGVERRLFVLFVLGTLQVLVFLVKPKPDHKYRFYWNVYHQSVGYAVIILSIINVFEGFDILEPAKKWKNAYIGVLVFLGACAVVLESITLYVVIKRRWLLNYLTT
ncbi:hypothetical protein SASPL_109423 [Salvia splendens]|uniref:Cytochrome b561 domain-containing protein n=1 Tax=Salvia splendens TaxID=180675 RepID=A0A8X8YGH5_SALSN|nr:hypothetical protein SASPL_109423 [Salvia splendens]